MFPSPMGKIPGSPPCFRRLYRSLVKAYGFSSKSNSVRTRWHLSRMGISCQAYRLPSPKATFGLSDGAGGAVK